MLTLLTTFTSIAIAVPAPHYLQSKDAKSLLHDKEAPSLYNDHQATSKHEISMAAPVDVGYDPCLEGQDVCKKWCAKNTKSWPSKCTFSKYCAGCTQCASVDDEQAFCLAVTAPWATKCAWEKCHGHAQCSNGAVPCESPTPPPSIPPSAPPSAPPPSAPPPSSESSCVFNPTFEITLSNGTTEDKSVRQAVYMCNNDYSDACFIAKVGCAPSAWDVSALTSLKHAFYHAKSFNQDLSDWDVSGVTFMQYMFYGATSFNQDLTDWDVSAVTTQYNMFKKSPMSCNMVPTKLGATSDTSCTA